MFPSLTPLKKTQPNKKHQQNIPGHILRAEHFICLSSQHCFQEVIYDTFRKFSPKELQLIKNPSRF